MKRSVFVLSVLLMLCPVLSEAKNRGMESEELKVMSYNVRLGTGKDGTNAWGFRCAATTAMLEDQRPDVFGVQEALDFQLDYIAENNRAYRYVGVGRDDGKKKGECMAIFYNRKTVKILKWGTFWLSETPDVPSKGWDARCKRSTTWALMKDKETGRKFYFINTHLDHRGVAARKNGLCLILQKLDEINKDGYPVVLTGDFNIKPDDEALVELDKKMSSARNVAAKTDTHNTFNGWGKAGKDMIIDYIYISGFTSCPEYQTITKKYADKTFISDHYPISATLIF